MNHPKHYGRYRKIAAIAFSFLWLIWLSGCGKSPEPAAGPEFPDAQYLTARAGGPTETDARRQALAELAGIFESRIISEFKSLSRSSVAGDQAEVFEREAESKVRVGSDVILQGARIGNVWKDEGDGSFHALAVLNRNDAGRTWASEAALIDKEIRALNRSLETTRGNLSRLAALNRIIDLASDRLVLESRMRVVGYPGPGSAGVDLGAMMTERQEILSGLKVMILVHGDQGGWVRDIMAQAFGEKGIGLAVDPARADARVLGIVDAEILTLKNATTRFARAYGSIRVFEGETLFVQFNEDVRKGHMDENEARHRAVEYVANALSSRLLSALGYE